MTVPPLGASAILATFTLSTDDEGSTHQATTKIAKAIKQAINITKPPLKSAQCSVLEELLFSTPLFLHSVLKSTMCVDNNKSGNISYSLPSLEGTGPNWGPVPSKLEAN